ncbi:MAG: TPM domain-containing protein [Clostridia bacterium]|nr:TPM domain-containing protein [Clostridia bacterium]
MKKLLCCFLLLLLLCTSAYAAPLRVADNASLLTDAETDTLLKRADELSAKHGLDIIIATTNDSKGMTLGYYAADLVDYNDFRTDNIILVVAMDQRKYVCVTTGYGIYAFTDYTLEKIYDAMESDMIDGNYFDAFMTYLNISDRVITQAREGNPYDTNNPLDTRSPQEIWGLRAVLALIPGVIIGWVIAFGQKKRMKSSVPQRSAENYLTHMDLRRSNDIYLYTTTSRVKVQTNNGGGGSSSFSGSSGRSHGGGGGGRSF